MSIESGLNEYSDLNLRYKMPSNYEDIVVVGERAIIESLRNIFYTETGTRFFNRDFGSRLHFLLFDNMNEDTANLISMTIYNVLKKLEPRIEVYPLGIEVTPDYENNSYYVIINYKNLTNGQMERASTVIERNR